MFASRRLLEDIINMLNKNSQSREESSASAEYIWSLNRLRVSKDPICNYRFERKSVQKGRAQALHSHLSEAILSANPCIEIAQNQVTIYIIKGSQQLIGCGLQVVSRPS